ncbi:MAG: L-serine ammonia-lyase, iron-sulfur-dependent, subunit alpha [Syntrophomonadaceae bacterium]|nr:L-serine ammonia-lyase, iron-sulfur-dependent, subunit alpha [Syntrophomonadaceae bacterium]
MFQYNSGEELLRLCASKDMHIDEMALQAEVEYSGQEAEQIKDRLEQELTVMRDSIQKGLGPGLKSMGGLIGGNAWLLHQRLEGGNYLVGNTLLKVLSYVLAVTEVNACMGKVVAVPTAGASGVVPGILLALQADCSYSDDQVQRALLVGGAIGKIIATNASLSGAEGGCQAECGSASAMAAAGAVYMAGGSPDMCLHAAAMALKGLLGLVCDPVAGLVEVPCSKRNATSAANALACAEMALAGIKSFIPFDEVVEAMARVGKLMSPDLKETAAGGCAATPTAQRYCQTIRIPPLTP